MGLEKRLNLNELNDLAKSLAPLNLEGDLSLLLKYHTNYAGISRTELRTRNGALYFKFRQRGLINLIPLRETSKKRRDFGKSALAYYQKHYDGLTKWPLFKTDRTLYRRLLEEGTLDQLPLAKKGRPCTIKNEENQPKIQNKVLMLPIECLDLPTRYYNVMQIAKIKTIGDLMEKTDENIKAIRGGGKKTVEIINKNLRRFGLKLKAHYGRCPDCSRKHQYSHYAKTP